MHAPHIKKLILDLDGVLIDTFTGYLIELYEVARALGAAEPPYALIKKHWGKGLEEFLGQVLPGIKLSVFLKKSAELGFRKNKPRRFQGVRRKLALLAEYYPVSILSNRTQPSLSLILEINEINRNIFRFIQSGSDIPRAYHKPSPMAFSKIVSVLRAEGIRRREILYVGDNTVDYEATHGAGLRFVGVTSGGLTTRKDFLGAGVPEEHILDSFCDLPKFLNVPED